MNLFEAIAKRHSYRGEFADSPVPRKDLEKIVQAGIQAPSACNAQVATFVIVDDAPLLRQIAETDRKGTKDQLAATMTAAIAQATAEANDGLDRAMGRSVTIVAQAMAVRWYREFQERAMAEAFPGYLAAYRAAPRLFMLDRWLEVWDAVLPDITKYVLAVDRSKVDVWLNLEEQSRPMSEINLQGNPKPGGK